jgi:hypothetical protein
MKTNHHRRSIRLPGFDYSQPGMYFVTLCVREKECVLGHVVNGMMQYTPEGQLAYDAWEWLQETFIHINVDTFCLMYT